MATSFSLPRWYDLHVHLRQDELLAPVIDAHIKGGCAGVLAMPNTKPPVGKIKNSDDGDYWSIESYRDMILSAGGDAFEQLICPLYLTKGTTPAMIESGAQSGLLKACKYYPPHGTTNSDHGRPLATFIENGVLQAMADNDVVLCIHGEEHGLAPARYYDRGENAEEIFYREHMVNLREKVPNLKIVCEHITTKVACDFVIASGDNITASITPQHLLYTVGDLLQGCKYHLYCMPLVKFDEDRAALQHAATDPNNTRFFAGSDSAPHTTKATECGCAAGCYTASIAPQLYADAFELAGCDLSNTDNQAIFRRFLCDIGADFYGLPQSSQTMTLEKSGQQIDMEGALTPLPVGINPDHTTKGTMLNWRLSL